MPHRMERPAASGSPLSCGRGSRGVRSRADTSMRAYERDSLNYFNTLAV